MAKDDLFDKIGDFISKSTKAIKDRLTLDITDLLRAIDANDIEANNRTTFAKQIKRVNEIKAKVKKAKQDFALAIKKFPSFANLINQSSDEFAKFDKLIKTSQKTEEIKKVFDNLTFIENDINNPEIAVKEYLLLKVSFKSLLAEKKKVLEGIPETQTEKRNQTANDFVGFVGYGFLEAENRGRLIPAPRQFAR